MEHKPKIFISYSTSDGAIAASLYKDLSEAGVDVFQFEVSATPGQPAWDEVLARIELSDIFILLASKEAIKSKPVQEEIKFAYYQHVNENKPAVLLPLVLEPNLQLPREIRANNFIPFQNYDAGFSQLSKFLKLEPVTKTPIKTQQPVMLQKPVAKANTRPPKTSNKSPTLQTKTKPSTTLRFDPSKYRRPALKETEEKLGVNNQALQPSGDQSSDLKDLFWYAAIIMSIGIGGALVGWFANGFLLHNLNVDAINRAIISWVDQHPWLLLSSKIFIWVLTGICAFYLVDDEYPVDNSDYAIVTTKAAGLTLLFGLIWSLIFKEVAFNSYSVILISMAVSTVVILVYAIADIYL